MLQPDDVVMTKGVISVDFLTASNSKLSKCRFNSDPQLSVIVGQLSGTHCHGHLALPARPRLSPQQSCHCAGAPCACPGGDPEESGSRTGFLKKTLTLY